MIIEMRTYRLKPGSVAEVEKRFAEGLKERIRVSPLGAFFHTEVGPLNQWIHVWAYKDAADRFATREKAREAGAWPPNTRGQFIRQENMLVVPAEFSPLR